MNRTERDGSGFLIGLALGALGPIVVALLLVPVRTELHNANLALMLVLVVVLAGDRRRPARRRRSPRSWPRCRSTSSSPGPTSR